ncbi:hypothetical protein [Halomonas sp. LC1]|uniref:hypothetical protein n=1 Tax=Halomonas sp. LC1 TaxID=3043733 RepID=UPI002555818D|nr:hypothetical protein [Halomonas sp. LC1]MDK9689158.1 hypothetical protein [Halomonas sp. LC1]
MHEWDDDIEALDMNAAEKNGLQVSRNYIKAAQDGEISDEQMGAYSYANEFNNCFVSHDLEPVSRGP